MSQENVEVVRAMIDAFNRRNFEASAAFFAEDASWRGGPAAPGGGVYYGSDEIARGFGRSLGAWEEFQVETEEVIDAGDHVVLCVRMRGKGRESGLSVELHPALVCEVRDGRVVAGRGFRERAEALEAVGLRG